MAITNARLAVFDQYSLICTECISPQSATFKSLTRFNYAVLEMGFWNSRDFPLLFWLDYTDQIARSHYRNIFHNCHLSDFDNKWGKRMARFETLSIFFVLYIFLIHIVYSTYLWSVCFYCTLLYLYDSRKYIPICLGINVSYSVSTCAEFKTSCSW
jgi:hypothetical protein